MSVADGSPDNRAGARRPQWALTARVQVLVTVLVGGRPARRCSPRSNRGSRRPTPALTLRFRLGGLGRSGPAYG